MTHVDVRPGKLSDVNDGVSVYERSNLARHQGDWPSRTGRVAQVRSRLREAALRAPPRGSSLVAMALIHPFRENGGSGDVIAGTWFLNLIYVLPERWGRGIGGMMLDGVIDEANRRGCQRIYLWTHECQNDRVHRLYRSRRFASRAHQAR